MKNRYSLLPGTRNRKLALEFPRTCFNWAYLKTEYAYHGLKSIAQKNGFVLLPFSDKTIYFRHFSNERYRFYSGKKVRLRKYSSSLKDENYEIRGCAENSNLSLTARMVLLWLEYFSIISLENIKEKKVIYETTRYWRYYISNETGSRFMSFDELKQTVGFPNRKNDYYFKKKVLQSVIELASVSFRYLNSPKTSGREPYWSMWYPILSNQTSAISSGINKQNFLEVKPSYAYKFDQNYGKVMIFPEYGLRIYEEKDAILFFLVSYISYRFSMSQRTDKEKMKIGSKALLEHIPSFHSLKDIRENHNSRYKEMLIKPLWDNIKRLPNGAEARFCPKDDLPSKIGDEEYPNYKDLLQGYFLFDVSDYCDTIKKMIQYYSAEY